MATREIYSDGFPYRIETDEDSNTVEVYAIIREFAGTTVPDQLVGKAEINHIHQFIAYEYYDLGNKTDEGSLSYSNNGYDLVELGKWIAGTHWQ